MEIRHLKPSDDRMEISRIYEEGWKFAYKGIIPQSYLKGIPEGNWALCLDREGVHSLVVVEDGKLIGTSSYCKSRVREFEGYGEIISIYLLLSYVGKGYGRKLLHAVMDELEKLGYSDIFLWVLEENHRARRFYEKEGLVCDEIHTQIEIGGQELREVRYSYKISAKTFLWIEDRKDKASYTFWSVLLKQLCPHIVVESKKNNSELVKAIKNLNDANSRYVIVFDNSFDNQQVVMEQRLLKRCVNEKENVELMDIICFEYILLEFRKLISWIYASDDEFLIKRAEAIAAREKLVGCMEAGDVCYKKVKEIVEYDKHINEHNIEQLSAKLLFDLTRNTGFEVSKGNIGSCWIKSCCEWDSRMDDDICGLDDNRLSVYEKMKSIYEGTCLKKRFHAVGLEVEL